jgi:hypothetical protein
MEVESGEEGAKVEKGGRSERQTWRRKVHSGLKMHEEDARRAADSCAMGYGVRHESATVLHHVEYRRREGARDRGCGR